jgi:hypothetical protein
MFRAFACGVTAVLLFAAPVAASAATYVASYSGIITNTTSATASPFGTSNLNGLAYTITFTYDPTLGSRANLPNTPSPGSAFYSVISDTPVSTPLLSATVTVNGVTDVIDYSSYLFKDDTVSAINNPAASASTLSFQGQGGGLVTFNNAPVNEAFYYNVSADGTGALPLDLSSWSPTAVQGGANVLRSRVPVGGSPSPYYNFQGTVTSAQVFATGGVPEPATWAMMLFGFGSLGYSMRRKKVRARIRFA